MSNKPGFFRQLKDTQNYSTKFLIVLFSPNSGVTPSRENMGFSSFECNTNFDRKKLKKRPKAFNFLIQISKIDA